MSDEHLSYLLTIDSGNSYVKWGLYSDNKWLKKGRVFYSDVLLLEKEFVNLPEPTIVVISHVARAITRDQLNALISIWPIKPYWIVAQTFQCDVANGYSDPAQLGSDRWAALIAAWRIQRHACLVINVGTAVTIDALSDSGRFVGGVIFPGAHLVLSSLLSGTQLVDVEKGNYQDFPLNTNDAIQSDLIQCLIGAIERMYNLLSLRLGHFVGNCVISGGDASILVPFIKFPTIIIDDLVLEGLAIIADDFQLNRKSAISS